MTDDRLNSFRVVFEVFATIVVCRVEEVVEGSLIDNWASCLGYLSSHCSNLIGCFFNTDELHKRYDFDHAYLNVDEASDGSTYHHSAKRETARSHNIPEGCYNDC